MQVSSSQKHWSIHRMKVVYRSTKLMISLETSITSYTSVWSTKVFLSFSSTCPWNAHCCQKITSERSLLNEEVDTNQKNEWCLLRCNTKHGVRLKNCSSNNWIILRDSITENDYNISYILLSRDDRWKSKNFLEAIVNLLVYKGLRDKGV